jgi:hypothetical protein
VTRGRSLTGALLVTLATPATWPLALGTFLLRGGIVLVAAPIVVIPTSVGLGNLLAPMLSSVAFGSVPTEFVVAVVAICASLVLWLVVGGWLAALLEAEGARLVARREPIGAFRAATQPGPSPDRHVARRILMVRLLASLPLGVVLAVGSVRLVFVTYRELTSPLDIATPIVVRVLRDSPEVVVAIVAAWMIAEIVGAMAARQIVLARAGIGGALRYAVATSLRQPASTLARFWLPTLVLALVTALSALVAAAAWSSVASVLGGRSDPLGILVSVLVFVGLWIVGLVLASVACAWRAAAWTAAEVTREGTFGGYSDRRPGHWQAEHPSATL